MYNTTMIQNRRQFNDSCTYLAVDSKSTVEVPQRRPVTTAQSERDGRQVVGAVPRDFMVHGQRTRRIQHAEVMTE